MNILEFLYQKLAKPVFFRRDPERLHESITRLGKLLGKFSLTRTLTRIIFSRQSPLLEQDIVGIKFKNPVGLSAGFDKNADLLDIMPAVGFGYIQVGTVTYYPYRGNPKPRVYRLVRSKSFVVYYGLKNIGIHEVAKKIQKRKIKDFPLGISIGKTNSKETVETAAGIGDYYECLNEAIEHNIGSFYTLNISCPNTFGGEPFTTPHELKMLLGKLYTLPIKKPTFLKMPINLPWREFKPLLDIALQFNVNGVIIGNLNKNRKDPHIIDPIPEHIKGSLSGIPTKQLSDKLISMTYEYAGDKLVIVGAGGIFSAQDAYEKIKRGASLVQLITGMIYQGPQLIGQINRDLAKLLQADGFNSVHDAIGAYHKKLPLASTRQAYLE